jgi:hypothetical protein
MQIFEIFAIISTKLILIIATPTPGVKVERYNSTNTLEERSHCYDHPAEKPDCRKGCGWYSFDSHVASNALVVAPPSDPLLCELFNGPLHRISMGSSCHCDIWRCVLLDCAGALTNNIFSHDNCQGDSAYELNAPIDSQDMRGLAYRCYRK